MLSGAAHRGGTLPALSRRCRDQPVPSTFGRKAPGEIATVRMPFGPHSTARLLVMASTPALAIALCTNIGRPSPSIGRDDVKDDTAVAFGDPTLAGRERAIGGAVQHDVEDGIDGAGWGERPRVGQ